MFNLETTYTALSPIFYKEMKARPIAKPSFLLKNEALAQQLNISFPENAAAILAGGELAPNATQLAQAYCGHQFGRFTMLGDGRAVLIGEHVENGQRVDIHLKGSGRTPFSRGGDGKAAVAPMLREYVISEAMHALGIPTTRSLAVVATGETIYRETALPGAVLTRIAASHIRVGTFQYARQQNDGEVLKQFVDYVIERHDPHLQGDYLAFLDAVIKRQMKLVAQWQLVGFVHGVMNTDNMTISGETIDYGPCAFLDRYDPQMVFSSIDQQGRYRYENQPQMAGWNLTRLAETLMPLIDEDEEVAIAKLEEVLMNYPKYFETYWQQGMRSKLGLIEAHEEDEALASAFLEICYTQRLDYTNTFRALTEGTLQQSHFIEWLEQWQNRLRKEKRTIEDAQKMMATVNPVVIPRNYFVERALQQAQKGDLTYVEELIDVLQNPFEIRPQYEKYRTPPAEQEPFVTYCGT